MPGACKELRKKYETLIPARHFLTPEQNERALGKGEKKKVFMQNLKRKIPQAGGVIEESLHPHGTGWDRDQEGEEGRQANPAESLRKEFGTLPSHWRDFCRSSRGNRRVIPPGDYPVISQGCINGS